jgi:hypothetical protein
MSLATNRAPGVGFKTDSLTTSVRTVLSGDVVNDLTPVNLEVNVAMHKAKALPWTRRRDA